MEMEIESPPLTFLLQVENQMSGEFSNAAGEIEQLGSIKK